MTFRPAVLLLVTFFESANVTSDGGIRCVLSYTGAEADYAIARAGRPATIYPGLSLATGDCVTIVRRTNRNRVDNENRVSLLEDSRKVVLTKGDTPHCLKPPAGRVARAAAVIARMIAVLSPYFRDALDDYNSEQTEPARSRGSQTPVIALAQRGPSNVFAGRRRIAVGWSGGVGPFSVSLYRGNGSHLISRIRAAHSRRARFPELLLDPGPYHLEVRDANGKRAAIALVALSQSRTAPEQPDEAAALRNPDTPREVRAVLEAGRLAQRTNWKFEAYQRVVDYVGTSDLARAVEFKLVAGD